MNVPLFRRSLQRWFSRAKRPLPWRRTRDAYSVWVSEMMLQQTTVATVIPYHERFMKRFPDVETLARADEDAVLSHWSGLGYYSRARNLRAAARVIVERHGGVFPKAVDEARTLPGVGPYTASAVTSIAYGARAAVVDGNVRRVLSRLFARRGLSDVAAQKLAFELLAPRASGRWNEAMMELGATVCTPQKPKCPGCPVASHCRGRQRPEYWSERTPRRMTVPVRVEMALVERNGRILLVRNPAGELMGGLYELPHRGMPRKAPGAIPGADGYAWLVEQGAASGWVVRHAVTHYRIEAVIHRAKLTRRRPPAGSTFHTIAEAWAMPLSGLTRKALRAAGLGS